MCRQVVFGIVIVAGAFSAGCAEDRVVYVDDDGGGGSSNAGSTGTTAPTGGLVVPSAVDLQARRLLADRGRSRFYAAVAGHSRNHPNEVVALDSAGTIVWSLFVGSEPDGLALSADGTTLWVGLTGADSVRRVALDGDGAELGAAYPVPPADDGSAAFPRDIVAFGSGPDTLAMLLSRRGVSPDHAGLVVVEAGVERSRVDVFRGISELAGGPDGWLFATGYELYALRATTDELVPTQIQGITFDHGTEITYEGGRLYTSSGLVIDAGNPSAPHVVGTFGELAAVATAPGVALLVLAGSPYEPDPTYDVQAIDSTTLAVTRVHRVTFGERGLAQMVTLDGTQVACLTTSDAADAPNVFLGALQ